MYTCISILVVEVRTTFDMHAFEQSNCLFSVKDKVHSGPIFAPLFNMKIEHVLWQLQKLPLTILISF